MPCSFRTELKHWCTILYSFHAHTCEELSLNEYVEEPWSSEQTTRHRQRKITIGHPVEWYHVICTEGIIGITILLTKERKKKKTKLNSFIQSWLWPKIKIITSTTQCRLVEDFCISCQFKHVEKSAWLLSSYLLALFVSLKMENCSERK